MRLGSSSASARLVPMLFVCGALPLLLCGCEFLQGKSLLASALCAALGFVFMLLCFAPFYLLQKRSFDLAAAAKGGGVGSAVLLAYYAAYFIIVAVSLAVRFTDMFTSSVNADADPAVMGLLIFAVCAYGALRGINGVSRVSIFVFAFLIVCVAVIFCGSAKYFDFSANSPYITPDFSDFTSGAADCLTLAFLPVVFGFSLNPSGRVKLRHAVWLSCAIFGLMLLGLFFVYFVCGSYSEERAYSFELLAQSSSLGDMRGFDSLYTAACTGCLFAAVSALLCCARRCVPFPKRSSGIVMLIFVFVAFVIFCLAFYIGEIKQALTDSLFLSALNIVSALVIPSVYLFKIGNGRPIGIHQ